MATNNVNGRINYTVGFNVDKRGLNNITQTLRQIQTMTVKDLINPSQFVNANQELAKVKQTAYEVEQALNRSFDTDLGTLNVSRFNQELKNLNINRI